MNLTIACLREQTTLPKERYVPMTDRLFVYGTLRNKYQGHMARLLRDNAFFEGTMKVKGYALYGRPSNGFPMVKINHESEVIGDMYVLPKDTKARESLIASLDSYEGAPRLFYRHEDKDNNMFIYIYNGSVSGYDHIEEWEV